MTATIIDGKAMAAEIRAEVRPALLLFGQGLFGAVFGLMGTIVATPMLVCLQVLTEYLWVERRLGKESGPSQFADAAASSGKS